MMGLTRSENMARIRSENTSPERILRAALSAVGLEFSPQLKTSAGRPDLVLESPPTAIFIDGCFWHGCPEHYVRPRSREVFWAEKLQVNVARDRRQTLTLQAAGWRVLRVWEHEVYEQLPELLERIAALVSAPTQVPEPSWRVVKVEVVDPSTDLERRVQEDLQAPPMSREVTQHRVTRKWKKPPGWKVTPPSQGST